MSSGALLSGMVTVKEGSTLRGVAPGFRPQYFACLFSDSGHNVRIELYKSQEDAVMRRNPPRMVPIRPQCEVKVNKEKKSFTIGKTTIIAQNDNDLKKWTLKLYQVQPSIKGLSGGNAGLIYDVVGDPKNDVGPFVVTLQQSDVLSFHGPCQIEVQPQMENQQKAHKVAVYDLNQPPRLIIRWQIDHLRGYGSNDSLLKIVTGRRTTTGIGDFIFHTDEGQRIHKCIHYWAQDMTGCVSPTSETGQIEPSKEYEVLDKDMKSDKTLYAQSAPGATSKEYELLNEATKKEKSVYGELQSGGQPAPPLPMKPSNDNYASFNEATISKPSMYGKVQRTSGSSSSYGEVAASSGTQKQYASLNRDTKLMEGSYGQVNYGGSQK